MHNVSLDDYRTAIISLIKNKQWEIVLTECDDFIHAFPQQVQGYVWKGNALVKLGRYQQAEAIFAQIKRERPKNVRGLRGLAQVAVRTHQWPLAFERCEDLIKAFPQQVQGYVWKGDIFAALTRFKEAKVAYAKAIELFPEHSVAYIKAATVFQKEDRHKNALRILEQGMGIADDTIRMLDKKAEILIEIGRTGEAREILSNLAKEHSNSEVGLVGLAKLSEKEQDVPRAISLWRDVINRFPDNELAQERIGVLFVTRGELDKAQEHYRLLYPHLPLVSLFGLSHVHALQRKDNQCIDVFRMLISMGYEKEVYPRFIMFLMERGSLSQLIPEIENYYQVITDSDVGFSPYLNQLMQSVAKRSGEVGLESLWLKYVSIVEACKTYRLSESKNVFPLCLLAITFVQKALIERQVQFVRDAIDLISKEQEFFRMQHLLLFTIYRIIGQNYTELENYKEAVAYLRYSLRLVPENQHAKSTLKQAIAQHYARTGADGESVHHGSGTAVMVIACEKYRKKIEILREKIYSKLGVSYYFVIGVPDLEDDWKREGDTLYVRCPDNYESLAQKVLKAYEFLGTCSDHTGVLKIDDDVWIPNIEKFREFVGWLEHSCSDDYLGVLKRPISRTWHFHKCESDQLNTYPYAMEEPEGYWCAGGWGYFLSRRSISALADYSLKYGELTKEKPLYEDLMVANILHRAGIAPQYFSFEELGIIQIEQDPTVRIKDLDYLLSEIRSCTKENNHAKALEYYRQVLTVDSELSVDTYCAISTLLVKEGNGLLARSILELALEKFPDHRNVVEETLQSI